MAGHSKWANIQHRKGKQDAKRGKLFTKLIREITAAARLSGRDPGANPRLRAAIDTALANNMTRDTIDRAVLRGSGGMEGESLEEVRYEGYGPGGVAVMVECMTDNRNRTVSEVRHAFAKAGGNMGTDGSVSYLFKKQGVLSYPRGTDEDVIMAAALEAGADDVIVNDDDSVDVLVTPEEFGRIQDTMAAAGLTPEVAQVTMRASTNVSLAFEEAQKMVRLLETLEDLDDVQNVYSNADISEEVLARL
ncbi:MAG TPA: YebC/PmpR family DNA-binding transcriptional regulator [Gammaproteobacteria bacterium]|nr:YebC/PmpR family DNA-binding transcriptional regulator [Gammaproteobacteria bacterium]